jgi:hypothetical protein
MGFRSVISIMSTKSFTYDPNAYAVITAIQSTGVSLTTSQELSCNNLIKRYKAANIWTKQKALYGVLGGTAGAHKWNWVNPLDTNAAFRLQFFGTWTHNNLGMTPSTAYANTFLNPSIALALNSANISYYSLTLINGSYDMGSQIVGAALTLDIRDTGASYVRVNTTGAGTESTISNADGKGFYQANRNSATIQSIIKNNTINNFSVNSVSRPNANIFIGAINNPVIFYGNKQCAFASIGDGLTDAEVSDQFNIVEQYQRDNGRGTVVGFVPTTEIGTGTSNNYEMPFKGIYHYSISASIYLQSELGNLPKRIKSIQFYFAGFTTPYTVTNQEIWIAEVAQSSFDTAPAVDFSDLTITNLTQVKTSFTHTVTANNQWYQFDFTTPFTYNGTSNLIVIWKNYDGSATISGAGYGRTTSATSRGMYKFNDPSFPTGDGTRINEILNAKFIWDFVD